VPATLRIDRFLLSDDSQEFRRALARERSNWAATAAVGGESVPDPAGARTVLDVLHRNRARTWRGAPDWLAKDTGNSVQALTYKSRAAGILAFGAHLLFAGVPDPRDAMTDLARVAFGVQPSSTRLADVLLAPPLRDRPPPAPGGPRDGFDDFLRRTCAEEIMSAGTEFGKVAAARPRPFPGAEVSDVDPRHACPGEEVTVRGTGFGDARPDGVSVVMTRRGGACVAAEVVRWSDTELVVRVPPEVGYGCVGLIQQPPGFDRIAEVSGRFADALDSCLGPVAHVAAHRIRTSLGSAVTAACPDCADPRGRFGGGPPVIRLFTANNRSLAEVVPGVGLELRWIVEGATEVTITPEDGVLPALGGLLDPANGQRRVENLRLADGTVARYRLTATNRCGDETAWVTVVFTQRTAIVLAVGGAKGAFEVGAVRCLRDAAGVTPKILSGASVGAVNAAKLAEGPGALQKLELLWRGMQSNSDFYREPAWFQRLEPVVQELFRASASSLGAEVARGAVSAAFNLAGQAVVAAMGIPGWTYSVFTNVIPVLAGIIDAATFIKAVSDALAEASIFDRAPLEQKVHAEIDPGLVKASGIDLRLTAVELASGGARVFDQNGVAVGVGGPAVPLHEVVLASASIPVAFPPVRLPAPDGPAYVDAGVRENVPIRAAVEAGAHHVYAILPNVAHMDPVPPSFSPASMVNVAKRSTEIVLDEMQVNDMNPFRGWGVPVSCVAPCFLVNDTLQVDPGLISINMAYGYMRAYDEVVVPSKDLRTDMTDFSNRITTARIECWRAEHFACGARLPGLAKGPQYLGLSPDAVSLQAVRDIKRQISQLVLDRVAKSDGARNCVPSDASDWWEGWERHPWRACQPSPWDRMVSTKGIAEAEPPPPRLP
jgi:NTE family protein